MAQTAVCNPACSLANKQLCGWLLLSLDRGHERAFDDAGMIANMLGVRREGVTEPRGTLRTQAIRYRERITVVDRPGLGRALASATGSSKEFGACCPTSSSSRPFLLRRDPRGADASATTSAVRSMPRVAGALCSMISNRPHGARRESRCRFSAPCATPLSALIASHARDLRHLGAHISAILIPALLARCQRLPLSQEFSIWRSVMR